MPTLPHKATLDLAANKLFIDGEEFPWWITEDGVEVSGLLEKNAVTTLSFTMFVDTVEVIPKDDGPEDFPNISGAETEIVTNVYGVNNV